MPQWNRYDICCAYKALEYDWNVGGIVRERPSSQRRKESIGHQLHRMGVNLPPDEGAGWAELVRVGDLNQMDIYVWALARWGLSGQVLNLPGDSLAEFVKAEWSELIEDYFPQLLETA